MFLIVAGLVCVIMKSNQKETYGGRQNVCENLCYQSKYYDYCMNTCLQDSASEWTGIPDTYETDALQAPMPLDEETGGNEIVVRRPYRYDYPGH